MIITERNIDSLHVIFNKKLSPQETFPLVIFRTLYHIILASKCIGLQSFSAVRKTDPTPFLTPSSTKLSNMITMRGPTPAGILYNSLGIPNRILPWNLESCTSNKYN